MDTDASARDTPDDEPSVYTKTEVGALMVAASRDAWARGYEAGRGDARTYDSPITPNPWLLQ